jgi:hypothetical protein
MMPALWLSLALNSFAHLNKLPDPYAPLLGFVKRNANISVIP